MGDFGAFAALSSGLNFGAKANQLALKTVGGSRKRMRPLQLDDDNSKQTTTPTSQSKTRSLLTLDEPVVANKPSDTAEATTGKKRRTRRGGGKSKKGTNDDDKTTEMPKGKQQQQHKPVVENAKMDDGFADDEQVRAFRRRMGIKIIGNGELPRPHATFEMLRSVGAKPIVEVLLRNIEISKYKEPTAVQMAAVPVMMQGRDLIACAPTGSGKTAAFLIPIIIRLNAPIHLRSDGGASAKAGPRALIVAPTRELAAQILREFVRLSAGKKFKATLLRKATAAALSVAGSKAKQSKGSDDDDESGSDGNDSDNNEEQSNEKNRRVGGDLIIATPLRLARLLTTKALPLDALETLIFDEADRLFELGFLEQIDMIIAAVNECGHSVLRGMFSATMPPQVEALARSVLMDPVRITVGTANAGAETIDQKLMFVGTEEGKPLALRQLISTGQLIAPGIIFVQSKDRAKALYDELKLDGIKIDVMHADHSQTKRDNMIQRFRSGQIWFLIATDLMARGIDFKGVNCVVNYDFPTSAVGYVHRIGRTGRAGRTGQAVTLFTTSDLDNLRSIANVMRISGCEVPEWMLSLKKASMRKRRALQQHPPKRHAVGGALGKARERDARKRDGYKNKKRGGLGHALIVKKRK